MIMIKHYNNKKNAIIGYFINHRIPTQSGIHVQIFFRIKQIIIFLMDGHRFLLFLEKRL